MKFLRRRQRGKLSQAFTYKADGVIWQLLPTRFGLLVGEERDLEGKKTHFFCLDQHTGKVLWQHVTVYESWWVGVETVHCDAVVLHGFVTPELPIKKGIFVLDLMTGKNLWTSSELTFVAAASDSLFGLREAMQGNTLIEMQYRSGLPLQEWKGEEGENKLRELRVQESPDETIAFPHPVYDLETSHPDIAHVLQTGASLSVDAVEVLEHGESTVLFAARRKTPGAAGGRERATTFLYALERPSRTLLLEERLGAGIIASVSAPFFVQSGTLYYVKESNQLVAVKL